MIENDWINYFNNSILTYSFENNGRWTLKHYWHYSLDGKLMNSCLDDEVLLTKFMEMTNFLEEKFPNWKKLKIEDGKVYIKEKGFFKRWRKIND